MSSKVEAKFEEVHNLFYDSEKWSCMWHFLKDDSVPVKDRLLFHLGKMNYQVENGGWTQYFHNDFADGGPNSEGFMTADRQMIQLRSHKTALQLLKDNRQIFGEESQKLVDKLISFMEEFVSLIRLDDDPYVYEPCDECNGHDPDCDECNGSGEVEVDNEDYNRVDCSSLNDLDTRYYEFNEEFVEMYNKYLI